MTTISEGYRAENARIHEKAEKYGAGIATKQWYAQVPGIAASVKAMSILDYGCGKGMLGLQYPHLMIDGYDPAIPGKDDPPEPSDMVTCFDVLEHVEPEYLDAVLEDLRRCARKLVFISVGTRPAKRTLSDGRNAHLSQHDANWWVDKLRLHWDMQLFSKRDGEFAFIGTPYGVELEEKVAA